MEESLYLFNCLRIHLLRLKSSGMESIYFIQCLLFSNYSLPPSFSSLSSFFFYVFFSSPFIIFLHFISFSFPVLIRMILGLVTPILPAYKSNIPPYISWLIWRSSCFWVTVFSRETSRLVTTRSFTKSNISPALELVNGELRRGEEAASPDGWGWDAAPA
jgi:hypothetical protein